MLIDTNYMVSITEANQIFPVSRGWQTEQAQL